MSPACCLVVQHRTCLARTQRVFNARSRKDIRRYLLAVMASPAKSPRKWASSLQVSEFELDGPPNTLSLTLLPRNAAPCVRFTDQPNLELRGCWLGLRSARFSPYFLLMLQYSTTVILGLWRERDHQGSPDWNRPRIACPSGASSREEFVAELGAAFVCADLGIAPDVRPDHAALSAHGWCCATTSVSSSQPSQIKLERPPSPAPLTRAAGHREWPPADGRSPEGKPRLAHRVRAFLVPSS